MKIPKVISRFVSETKTLQPLVIKPKNVSWIIEIQSFSDLSSSKNYLSKKNYLRFATTWDGNELLFDLNNENYEILQDERGDIDTLGITVFDLLDCEKVSYKKENL